MSAWIRLFCCGVTALTIWPATAADVEFRVQPAAGKILEQYCVSCHEDGTSKGDIRLDNLESLTLDARLDLLNRVQEQVFLGDMPPKKKKPPTDDERNLLAEWVGKDLKAHGASKLEDKLRMPGYVNAINHDKLFSGKITDAPYTPARRWLVSPQIYDNRLVNLFGLDTKKPMRFYGITNPFLLPNNTGVRYYDNGALTAGHLLTLLGNAEWISNKQIRPARVKNQENGRARRAL